MSMSLMEFAIIGGCAVGTLLYVFAWQTTLRQKIVVVLINVAGVVLHLPTREGREGVALFGFILQIFLCIYYAFYYKMEQM